MKSNIDPDEIINISSDDDDHVADDVIDGGLNDDEIIDGALNDDDHVDDDDDAPFDYDDEDVPLDYDDAIDDDEIDDANVPVDEAVDVNKEKSYVILKEDDLVKRVEEEVNKVSSILTISKDVAYMLLFNYSWRVSTLNEAWFDDEFKVRKCIGILDVDINVKFPKRDRNMVDCGICFDSVMVKDTANCGCDHVFCKGCWKSYVTTAVNDGPGCLSLKCPEPSCRAAVGPDMVNVFVKRGEKKKYDRFWLRSYVESNEMIKWCPGPGCECAVEFVEDVEVDNYDVSCECSFVFCWKCLEDAHRPLGCETVNKWVMKNTAEAENTTWILAYTKPCPKCKRSIEKNHGCMHMTCRPPCNHEFCWLCLGPYRGHDNRSCNAYTTDGVGGSVKVNKDELQRQLAQKAIVRYTHYYERWAANEKSRKQALKDLHKIETVDLKKLSSSYSKPETDLQYIIEAWLQIVECRRVLKWTYAYGFYIPKEEVAKKLFFEYVQGEAEGGLERLHLCAEKEVRSYIETYDWENFMKFRVKLVSLTSVTRTYFQNLVKALQNGLSEVDSHQALSKTSMSLEHGDAPGSSIHLTGQKRSYSGR